jgi:hypothetical protein
MATSQFDLATVLRCSDTDLEGFRCRLRPGHDGPHEWARCDDVDAEGHRCMLPPRHPGRHYQPWYDRHATAGDMYTLRYGGTERETSRLAEKAAAIAARYGWVERSRTFLPGLPWRLALLRPLFAKLTTNGQLAVVFERTSTEAQDLG